MTVSLSPILNGYQAFTAAGLPLSGGFLYTYQAGTSTLQATFTTNSGLIANSNPIQLDAAGRPPQEIWLIDGQAYRFVQTDSLGSDLRTFDNISTPATALLISAAIAALSATLAASSGSDLIGFLQAGAGAVARTLQSKDQDNLSVLDFGTGFSGFPAATALGGGEYLIPRGTYVYTTGLVINQTSFPDYQTPSARMSIRGDSLHSAFLTYNGTAASYALTLTGPPTFASVGLWSYSKYQDLTFQDSGHTLTRNGLSMTNLSEIELRRLSVNGFAIGMYLNSCLISKFDSIWFKNNGIGLVLDSTTGQSLPNALTFDNCTFSISATQGVVANVMGATNRFASCRFEANGAQGVSGNGGCEFNISPLNGQASMLFESCYWEGNAGTYDCFLTNTGSAQATIVFVNCTFNRTSNTRYVTTNVGGGNSGGGSMNIVFIGCSFLSANTYVPNASRPFFSASDNKVLFIDGGGNSFSEDTSRATSFFSAGGRVNGATGAILTGAAPFSCVRNSAGNYTVTSSVPFGPTTNDITVSVTPLTSSALVAAAQISTSNTLTVFTRAMTTGTATDCDFAFNFAGLKG